MLSADIERLLQQIQDASLKGPTPPELYEQLRTVLHEEATRQANDITASASLRLIADTLPILRQWMDIEHARQTPVIPMLDAICNAMSTLIFNAVNAVSTPGTATHNAHQLLGKINWAVVHTAQLQDHELPHDQRPN
jgi:hypothetical protein